MKLRTKLSKKTVLKFKQKAKKGKCENKEK